jgi:hypothetical protein
LFCRIDSEKAIKSTFTALVDSMKRIMKGGLTENGAGCMFALQEIGYCSQHYFYLNQFLP